MTNWRFKDVPKFDVNLQQAGGYDEAIHRAVNGEIRLTNGRIATIDQLTEAVMNSPKPHHVAPELVSFLEYFIDKEADRLNDDGTAAHTGYTIQSLKKVLAYLKERVDESA